MYLGGVSLRGSTLAGVVSAWMLLATLCAGEAPPKPRKPDPLVPLPAKVPAPANNPTTREKVSLGKQLFFDPRLSGDNTMSCATCHVPEKALGDGRARAKGAGGKELSRNTPSIFNVAFYSAYFWDGRAASLEEQALGPIGSPDEMNQNLDRLEQELDAVPGYVRQFQAVFGTPVTRDGIAKSLAAFERTLITRNSPFDRYLQGDKRALSLQAKHGMELFLGEVGCVRCHHGPLLSDGKYYRLGVSFRDPGRGAVTGKKEDRYAIRTPTLRNVARTGPYMHDGSMKSLEEVVQFYFRAVPIAAPDGLALDVEPLLELPFYEIDDIMAFLDALTGDLPKIEPPKLP